MTTIAARRIEPRRKAGPPITLYINDELVARVILAKRRLLREPLERGEVRR